MHKVLIIDIDHGIAVNGIPYVRLIYNVDNHYFSKIIRKLAITCMADQDKAINYCLETDGIDPEDCDITRMDLILVNATDEEEYYAVQR